VCIWGINVAQPDVSGPVPGYEIILAGHLDPLWLEWFDGLEMTACPDGTTHLTGSLPDQAALRAILDRIFDLNLTLRSLRRL
jgi:hypothetical protein